VIDGRQNDMAQVATRSRRLGGNEESGFWLVVHEHRFDCAIGESLI
jgi:hypothetical protein